MVRFDNLSYTYRSGSQGLKELNLEIQKGEFFFIVASSAEFKTTFLNLIYGKIFPASGALRVFEHCLPRDKKKILAVRRNIGYAFNPFYLFEHLTIRENLLIPLCIKSTETSSKQHEDIITEMYPDFSLPPLKTTVAALSSGQKQQLNLFRALITHPALLLADDPFSLFPKEDTDRFMAMLDNKNKNGMTIIATASSPDIPKQYNKPYRILKEGRLINVDN